VPIVTGQHDFEKVAQQVGRALNREAQMGDVKRGYDERSAAVAAELSAIPAAQLPVSQLRLREDNVRVMMETSNAGRVMAAAGRTFQPMLPGAEMNTETGAFYETSLELLPEAIGEHVFVFSTDEGVLEKTTPMPVWQQLSAVRNGTVHEVDFEPWMRGQGYLAAHAVLDDIEAAYGVGAN
jgi:iron complex transport system substrate-binding protein